MSLAELAIYRNQGGIGFQPVWANNHRLEAYATSQTTEHPMQTALVLGNVTSTVKHASLENLKLLLCQPMLWDGTSPDGPPLIAVDLLGAGIGETVMITSDGGAIRDMFQLENSPIRWSVLGLVDEPRGPT